MTTIEISKPTIIFGIILLVLRYFLGNTLPITENNTKSQPGYGIITSTIGEGEQHFSFDKVSLKLNLLLNHTATTMYSIISPLCSPF